MPAFAIAIRMQGQFSFDVTFSARRSSSVCFRRRPFYFIREDSGRTDRSDAHRHRYLGGRRGYCLYISLRTGSLQLRLPPLTYAVLSTESSHHTCLKRTPEKGKAMHGTLRVVLLTSICSGWAWGQTLSTRPAESHPPSIDAVPLPAPISPEVSDSIPLTVPAGTPLKVALDQELRIQKVGQPVHGKVVEPVYSFDKIVVPAGS